MKIGLLALADRRSSGFLLLLICTLHPIFGHSSANNAMKLSALDPPQFEIPGEFAAPFDVLLNNIPEAGLDLDNDGTIDIVKPCSCQPHAPTPNGTNNDERFFDDQLVVATGTSGQIWQVSSATNLYHPLSQAPIAVGTPLEEVGNTGIYVLKVIHQETVRYRARVTSPDYPDQEF
ncbi:MAG: hypothetical protein F6K19_20145, partial [Cyanothece sp. SIO1E1]|nr:hypothetical protein [Cyanothece sp. SIO1E1]